ncbi:MAG: hypothetical protein GY750_03975 [Lentisphaerae bacterium]|nr:hypothetical protein [Lentisphaerota bacterium]
MQNNALGNALITKYDLDYLKGSIDCVLDQGSNGIALMWSGKRKDLDSFLNIANSIKNIPVITVQRRVDGFKGTQLLVDEVEAGVMATKHLISLGHKRLALVAIYGSFFSNVVDTPFTSIDWPWKSNGQKISRNLSGHNKKTGNV